MDFPLEKTQNGTSFNGALKTYLKCGCQACCTFCFWLPSIYSSFHLNFHKYNLPYKLPLEFGESCKKGGGQHKVSAQHVGQSSADLWYAWIFAEFVQMSVHLLQFAYAASSHIRRGTCTIWNGNCNWYDSGLAYRQKIKTFS